LKKLIISLFAVSLGTASSLSFAAPPVVAPPVKPNTLPNTTAGKPKPVTNKKPVTTAHNTGTHKKKPSTTTTNPSVAGNKKPVTTAHNTGTHKNKKPATTTTGTTSASNPTTSTSSSPSTASGTSNGTKSVVTNLSSSPKSPASSAPSAPPASQSAPSVPVASSVQLSTTNGTAPAASIPYSSSNLTSSKPTTGTAPSSFAPVTQSSAAPLPSLSSPGLFTSAPPPPVIVAPPPSKGSGLTSVDGTDTGSSMFNTISSNDSAVPPPSSAGAGSGKNPATNQTGSGSQPSGNAPPADSSDRAMNVVAQPPAVQPVNHSQPLPQHVTSSLSPGLVDHFQPSAPPPANGVPGVTTNFSSSGNSNGW